MIEDQFADAASSASGTYAQSASTSQPVQPSQPVGMRAEDVMANVARLRQLDVTSVEIQTSVEVQTATATTHEAYAERRETSTERHPPPTALVLRGCYNGSCCIGE